MSFVCHVFCIFSAIAVIGMSFFVIVSPGCNLLVPILFLIVFVVFVALVATLLILWNRNEPMEKRQRIDWQHNKAAQLCKSQT